MTNRNEEFTRLLKELDETPLKLDFTLDRARLKRKEHHRQVHRAVFAPLGTLAAVFAVFVLLVNVSPTFAYAAGRLPVLRELAKFVAMSPSLSAAVENEYVQPMGLEQTEGGVTARIEYVIVDQKQLNIFYTLSSDMYSYMDATPDFMDVDDRYLSACAIVSGGAVKGNGELHKLTADFSTGTVPDTVKLRLRIRDLGSEYGEAQAEAPAKSTADNVIREIEQKEPTFIAQPEFTLSLDTNFTDKGDKIELNKTFELDGQSLTLTDAEIYPTHMRLIFDDKSGNTAWPVSLAFYVENEKGERFEGISDGVTAFGKPDSPMTQTYMLESPFFSKSKHLTLYITGVTWLDKSMEKVRINLADKTAEALPEGVEFETAKKAANGWVITFSAPEYEESHFYQLWKWSYYDSDGKEYDINEVSSATGEDTGGKSLEALNRFGEALTLKDYPYDEVWLCPAYSRRVTLDTPVSIEIK